MPDAALTALITGAFGLVAALLGIGSTAWTRHTSTRTAENERRLSALEAGNEHLMQNLRLDYDRALARAVAAERSEAEWRRRALSAERQIETYFQDREKKQP